MMRTEKTASNLHVGFSPAYIEVNIESEALALCWTTFSAWLSVSTFMWYVLLRSLDNTIKLCTFVAAASLQKREKAQKAAWF